MVRLLHSTSFVYDENLLSYDFGQSHPFRPERISKCMDILRTKGAIGNNQNPIVSPRIASYEEVRQFHTVEYLDFVRKVSVDGNGILDSGDTPAFRGCYEASLAIVGATLTAIELVASGMADHSVNFAGGLHHARKGNASGFCILNDCAVGIAYLKKKYNRIAYIDADAHHGDGVIYGFYDDPQLLTIDIHQDGSTLFPGTGNYYETGAGDGEGYKVNLPIPPGSGDDILLSLANDIVLPVLKKHKPDYIIMQCGADGLEGDPLAQLSYSKGGLARFIDLIHDASHDLCGGRLVLTGGGGYNTNATAECWAEEFAVIGGAEREFLKEGAFSVSDPWILSKVKEMADAVKEALYLE